MINRESNEYDSFSGDFVCKLCSFETVKKEEPRINLLFKCNAYIKSITPTETQKQEIARLILLQNKFTEWKQERRVRLAASILANVNNPQMCSWQRAL